MHLAFLPGLLLALVTGGSSGAPVAQSHVSYIAPLVYSLAAQTTPVVTATGTTTSTVAVFTPTAAITPSSVVTSATDLTPSVVVTPSESITATATISSPGTPLSTAVPLPTAAPPSQLQGNPFDINYLTSAPSPDALMGPFAWGYLAFMVALFGVSAYFYFFRRPDWKRNNSVLYKATNRWGPIGIWIGIIGLLFLLFRIVKLDGLNLRFWLYLMLLIALVAIGWFVYWYRTAYPKEVARYQKVQRARQYMPGGSKGSVRVPAGPSTKVPQPQKKATSSPSTPRSTTTTAAEDTMTAKPSVPAPQQQGARRRKRR